MARIGCSYHHYSTYNVKTLVHTIDCVSRKLKALKSDGHAFDAIAFTGSSGAAIAFPISALDGYPLVFVRKPSEDSHGLPVEGPEDIDIKRYIVLDDFTSTGATVNLIITTLARHCPSLTCIGAVLYRRDYDQRRTVLGQKFTFWGVPGIYDYLW